MTSREFLSNYAGGTIYGLHFKVRLDFDQSIPGKTVVKWTAYFMVDEPNVSNYSAAAYLDLVLSAKEGSVSSERIEAIPWKENDGYYHFPSAAPTTGSFIVTHTSEGKASFNLILEGNIGGYKKPFVYKDCGLVELDINIPYTKCGAPTLVSASGVITPNGTFTVSWSGASSGHSNNIKGYDIYYLITSSGSAPTTSTKTGVKTVNSTSTSGSTTITVSGASRGYTVVCGVVTKGSVDGYNSSIKTGGSVKINELPAAPIVSVNKNLVSYNQGKGGQVTFILSQGTDPEGAVVSYSYSTSISGTKIDLDAGKTSFTPTVAKNTTYYFWTKDSCNEYSSSYSSQAIQVNTNPTMSISFNKTQTDNFLASDFTVNFAPGANGQSSGNKYTFGYTFEGQNYTLLNSSTSTSYNIGDIRKKLSPLNQNKTYELEFFATRNDNYDTSNKVTAIYSFTTPTITLSNDNGVQSSFSKILKISMGSGVKGTYTLAQTGNAIVNTDGKSFNTSNVAYGTTINQINFSEGFSVNTTNSLTKVKAFEFSPSSGKTHPFLSDSFLVYTDGALNVSFLGKMEPEYGISSVPNLTMKITNISNSASLTTNGDSSSSDNTFTYSFNGKNLWNTFFTNLQNKTNQTAKITFSLTNNFNDTFTSKTFDLNLNFKGLIETSSCLLHTGDKYTKGDNEYKCLIQDWQYLKEGMGIYADLSVYSFYQAKAQLQIKRKGNTTWTNLGSPFSLIKGNIESNPRYNAARTEYTFADEGNAIATLGETLESYELDFRVAFSATDSDTIFFENDKWKNIFVKAHQIPSANFASISYINKQLSFKLAGVSNGKLPDDSIFESVSITIKETGVKVKNFELSDGTYSVADFSGYFTHDDNIYEFLHLAPIFESTLTTSLKSNVASYTEKYPTTKTTEQYLYTVIYDISPTIAYRKNHIGINTKEPSMIGDCVVIISDYGDRKKIYLNSSNHNAIVDLSSGSIENFIIDCGEW